MFKNKIRLLIGGSPCTHWSIAQNKNRETEPNGIGWELFKNYLIAKEKFQPDYFLYENVKSSAKHIKEKISSELKVPLQYINSSLVSAQNRQRFYAHNIPNVIQPEDRGIALNQIIETGVVYSEKGYVLRAAYSKASQRDFREHAKNRRFGSQGVLEPVCVAQRGIYKSTGNRSVKVEGDKINRIYEARIDGKTNAITTVHKDSLIAEPVRIGVIENKALSLKDSKQYRVYSSEGKSTTLCGQGGGLGAKMGLYATPIQVGYTDMNSQGYRIYDCKGKSIALNSQSGGPGINTGLYAIPTDKKIYEVRHGMILINNRYYPIKLSDGFYIIRKLTVTECKRLQTVREDYIMPCSDTQNYKMLGNGWTVDVIAWILSHIPNISNSEVEVLSMYDGMSCGNLALEKLGCKVNRYVSYEIDKYAIKTTQANYPYVEQRGDAFLIRYDNWKY